MSLIRHLTRIHFGEEVAAEAIAAELARHGIRRTLVLVDGDHAERVRVDVLPALPAAVRRQLVVVATGSGWPEASTLFGLARLFRRSGCDGILAAGGRATIELAKLVAVVAGGVASLDQLADPARALVCARARVPLIALATGAGSGAEASCTAALADEEGLPVRLCGEHLVAAAAIFDPLLTLGLDASATAAFAFEALARCVEAVAAPGYDPPAQAVALDGMARIVAALPAALENPGDRRARCELMAGALAAGLAGYRGQGGFEAAAWALARLARPAPARGALAAVLLPHLLAFNAPALGERGRALARALAGTEQGDPAEMVARLAERCGLPRRLSELGIGFELLERASLQAERDPASGTNPRPIARAHYQALFTQVI